jgi:putative heme iron utilization protein
MEVIAVFRAFIVVTVFTAAANTHVAIVDFHRPQWVLDNMTKWGRVVFVATTYLLLAIGSLALRLAVS